MPAAVNVLWHDDHLGPRSGRAVEFTAYGDPAPQGSKAGALSQLFPSPRSRTRCPSCRAPLSGRITMRESSKAVKPWRTAVEAAARLALPLHGPLDGPLAASMTFVLPRPAAHWGTGRNAGQLRASAPEHPAGYPDLSKLARATEDALTDAGLIADDARIVRYDRLDKCYVPAPAGRPGVWIEVRELSTGG